MGNDNSYIELKVSFETSTYAVLFATARVRGAVLDGGVSSEDVGSSAAMVMKCHRAPHLFALTYRYPLLLRTCADVEDEPILQYDERYLYLYSNRFLQV
jgi:hypothetical protein